MKFSFKPKDVLTELKLVVGSIGSVSEVPVLANFLIKLEQGIATITASDTETQMSVIVAVDIEQPGAITLPAKKFIAICSAVPADSMMTVTVKNERAVLQSGRSRFALSTLPAQHFASMGHIKDTLTFNVPTENLRNTLERVSHAMAKDDVRYYLNGMLFEIKQTGLQCVATDGHRLAMGEIATQINSDEIKQIIIPRKAIALISKVINFTDEVSMSIGQTNISINTDKVCLVIQLIEGNYPHYEKVIPKTNKKLVIDRHVFAAALQRANILTSKRFCAARLVLADRLLKIEVVNDQGEQSREELTIDFKGSIELGMNVAYLIEALNGCTTREACLALSEKNKGVVVQNNNDDSAYRCVVMPTRL